MHPYFRKMDEFGKTLQTHLSKDRVENTRKILEVETAFEKEKEKVKHVGLPAEKINARGQMTVWQRIEYLVDIGTWCPLHTLFNPEGNIEGTTNVFDGLARIQGK